MAKDWGHLVCLYFYLDTRNLCVAPSFHEVHAVSELQRPWPGMERGACIRFATLNNCSTYGNPSKWICISDFSISCCNLPREIKREPIKTWPNRLSLNLSCRFDDQASCWIPNKMAALRLICSRKHRIIQLKFILSWNELSEDSVVAWNPTMLHVNWAKLSVTFWDSRAPRDFLHCTSGEHGSCVWP